jgi:hypothetical protein
MEINAINASKIDPLLREKLQSARGNETIRVIMILGNDAEHSSSRYRMPSPSQFSSRTAWRNALIERRRGQLADDIGSTLQRLRQLSLRPQGGTLGHTVVVEGPIRSIAKSLELPGVRHASLDRPIELAEVS